MGGGGGNKSELEYTHLWTIGQQEAVEYTEYGYYEETIGALVPNDFRGLVYRTTGGELLTGGYISPVSSGETEDEIYYSFGDSLFFGMYGTYTEALKSSASDYTDMTKVGYNIPFDYGKAIPVLVNQTIPIYLSKTPPTKLKPCCIYSVANFECSNAKDSVFFISTDGTDISNIISNLTNTECYSGAYDGIDYTHAGQYNIGIDLNKYIGWQFDLESRIAKVYSYSGESLKSAYMRAVKEAGYYFSPLQYKSESEIQPVSINIQQGRIIDGQFDLYDDGVDRDGYDNNYPAENAELSSFEFTVPESITQYTDYPILGFTISIGSIHNVPQAE